MPFTGFLHSLSLPSLITRPAQINPCIQTLILSLPSEEPKPGLSKEASSCSASPTFYETPPPQVPTGQHDTTERARVHITTLPLTSGVSKLIPLCGLPSPLWESNSNLIWFSGRILAQSGLNVCSLLLAGWRFPKRSRYLKFPKMPGELECPAQRNTFQRAAFQGCVWERFLGRE